MQDSSSNNSIWTAPVVEPHERLAYDLNEIVGMTGVSAGTIRNRCRDNSFPYAKIGRRLLFPVDPVHELLHIPTPEVPAGVTQRATCSAVELAGAFRVSPRLIADWPERFGLPSIKLAGRRLYPVADAKRWLAGRAQQHVVKEGSNDEQG